MLKILNIEIRL